MNILSEAFKQDKNTNSALKKTRTGRFDFCAKSSHTRARKVLIHVQSRRYVSRRSKREEEALIFFDGPKPSMW
ncbi:unnamed protein product, partial [Nesidiocoris tenuis]